MERTYESAMALASRAAGPLAVNLGPWVSALIGKQYVAAVVYVKARHAVAFDRWLAGQRVDLVDLGEALLLADKFGGALGPRVRTGCGRLPLR